MSKENEEPQPFEPNSIKRWGRVKVVVWLFSDSEDFDGGKKKNRPFKPGTLEVGGLGVKSNKVSNQSSGAQVINHTIGAEAECFISRREVLSSEPLRTRWWTDVEENN